MKWVGKDGLLIAFCVAMIVVSFVLAYLSSARQRFLIRPLPRFPTIVTALLAGVLSLRAAVESDGFAGILSWLMIVVCVASVMYAAHCVVPHGEVDAT